MRYIPRVKMDCAHCGEPMEVEQWKLREGRGRFCSLACARADKRTAVTRQCESCGKEMRVEPGKLRRGIGRFCSMECVKASVRGTSYLLDPAEVEDVVKRYRGGTSSPDLARDYGVSPCTIRKAIRDAGVPMRANTPGPRPQRKKQLPLGELAQLYIDGHSTEALAHRYDVSVSLIGDRLRELGIKRRGGKLGNGYHLRCQDGHIVRSHSEQVVDNWLYSHEIAHAYEPPLPFGIGATGDFLARGYYIEVWGVKNRSRYDKRRAQKVAGYETSGLPLISLESDAILAGADLDEALRQLLPLES